MRDETTDDDVLGDGNDCDEIIERQQRRKSDGIDNRERANNVGREERVGIASTIESGRFTRQRGVSSGKSGTGGRLQVVSVALKHLKTGAHWLHIGADDSNNAFNVGFKTVPMDDTGVAHILEHTTLCGSKNYPVRDPFFNMLRRSLSAFMNAMTSADFTCYPFATMNRVDYDNLLGVYLDAVFFPKLEEQDFRQEGHRFEFAKTEDASSGLKYKGVVFNEMKGAMGSQNARFMRALGANLFPTSTFHYNSGGDPTAIPDLTYEQLKAFHALHYHPSERSLLHVRRFPVGRDVDERGNDGVEPV